MKVRIAPHDTGYQVILERCIEFIPAKFWDCYSDGDLYVEHDIYENEIARYQSLYGMLKT